MARRARLTTRTNRQRRRNDHNNNNTNNNSRRRNASANNMDVEQAIFLSDLPKCALNPVPIDFDSFSCGFLTLVCQFCQAKHFAAEVTARNQNAFSLCCHKGKVHVPSLTSNMYFQHLIEGLSSTDREIKQRSKNYLSNIRSYNSSFAMVSAEAQLEPEILRGIYHFKIHDVFYHRAGALTPLAGRNPIYAQLNFYDVETAVQYRMNEPSNNSCLLNLMHEIAIELDSTNPFVRSFRSLSEYCQRTANNSAEVTMVITVNKQLDIRRFNDAVQTDVAAIFKNDEGEPPFERNMVVFSKHSNSLQHISVLDPSLDPMAYPLLFPNGETGWHINYTHSLPSTSRSTAPRKKITMLQYASYRLAVRDEFSILHRSQKLFLQWLVDIYVRIEGTRLHFIRQNQLSLRTELYNNLTDFLHQRRDGNEDPIGRRVILPSSFIGSPRNMYQTYLDAMSIVQHFGKPSLFITMTCNPKWVEIVNSIHDTEHAHFRPDITVRVFRCKLKELIECIIKKEIFGKVLAIIYTIEFQKRGLPHAHILLTLCDRIDSEELINKYVCAEIPDSNLCPKLHEYVKRHMMHGPCGKMNPNSVCMKDGKCGKKFPKDFSTQTIECVNGYPIYRRRDNGMSVDVRGGTLNNRYVVPYNPYLLAKFDCHINVEVCSSIKSVKYIYKYVYKGYDSANIALRPVRENDENNNGVENVQLQDEIQNFLSGRYVGSTEAAWRIFEYPMHFHSHTIIRLDVHLPERQSVYFREGNEMQAAENPPTTKLLAFFQLNRRLRGAINQFLYTEIPLNYVWSDKDKQWTKRKRGADKIISRLYVVSPKNIELFHMRILLLHVRGMFE